MSYIHTLIIVLQVADLAVGRLIPRGCAVLVLVEVGLLVGIQFS